MKLRDKLTFKSGSRVGFRVRISSLDLESGSRVGFRVRISSQDFVSGSRVRISSQDLSLYHILLKKQIMVFETFDRTSLKYSLESCWHVLFGVVGEYIDYIVYCKTELAYLMGSLFHIDGYY